MYNFWMIDKIILFLILSTTVVVVVQRTTTTTAIVIRPTTTTNKLSWTNSVPYYYSSTSCNRQRLLVYCPNPNFVSSKLLRNSLLNYYSNKQSDLKMTKTKTTSSIDTTPISSSSILFGQIEIPIEDAIRVHGLSDVKFVDGSWWLGQSGRNRIDYETGPRISGATFLDIDDVADTITKPNLPHMMPGPILFSKVMDKMNIHNDDHIIVYVTDKQCPFVHRARYQFGCMGHSWDKVHVLRGSLKDWINSNGPIDTNPIQTFVVSDLDVETTQPTYQSTPSKHTVSMEEVRDIVTSKQTENVILIDARSPDRFYARVDEPRPGLIRGHMPTARNVFFLSLLDPDNVTKFKSVSELKQIFSDANIVLDNNNVRRYVATCGSGATACTVATALQLCGVDPNQISIYDGSWMEWGDPNNGNQDLIITTDD